MSCFDQGMPCCDVYTFLFIFLDPLLPCGGSISTFDEKFLFSSFEIKVYLKKTLNVPRPSEHPPVWGEKCQNV